MSRFRNKVVIITGGARGIGRAGVRLFASEGAAVIVWDIHSEKVKQEFGQGDIEVEFQEIDVTDFHAVENAAKRVFEKHHRIDVLINNAGVTRDATLLKMTADQWKEVMDVNLNGVFNCTKAVVPYMIDGKSGRVINTASVVGLYGNFGQTNYAASKSGVIGMTKVWARELGRKGITVNAVAPGFIATGMVKDVPEKILHAIIDRTPVGRLGTPEEIAHAYAFLASDEAAFINGATLSVDGGFVG